MPRNGSDAAAAAATAAAMGRGRRRIVGVHGIQEVGRLGRPGRQRQRAERVEALPGHEGPKGIIFSLKHVSVLLIIILKILKGSSLSAGSTVPPAIRADWRQRSCLVKG